MIVTAGTSLESMILLLFHTLPKKNEKKNLTNLFSKKLFCYCAALTRMYVGMY